MTSVKKNFGYNATYQVVRILTPLLTVPYLSRVLGPECIGLFSYTYSITNYFFLLSILGMSTYGVRAIAAAGASRTAKSRVFWNAYASQVSISLVVIIAYLIYVVSIGQGGLLLCMLWGFWVLSAAIDVTWLMFGVEDFRTPTIRNIIVKIIELALIFALVKSWEDLWIYVAIISGGFFVSQLVIWPFIPKYVDFVRPTWREMRIHYYPNLRLFIPVVAISLYTTMDKVLLGVLSTMTQTGFYEYSDKVARIPLALITALGTVMLPRMSSLFSSGNEQGGKELIETSMWFMQAGAFAMTFGIIAISPEFATVFLGGEFSECAPVMAVLSCMIPLISGSNVIGKQYLLPKFRDNQYTASVICGAILNIVAIFVLVPFYGAIGAAVATVSAELAVLIAQGYTVKSELPLSAYLKNTLPFFVSGCCMLIAIRASAFALNALWGLSVQGLVVEILIGAAVFVLFSGTYCILTKNRHFLRIIRKA